LILAVKQGVHLSFLKTTALLTVALLATPVFAASNVRRSSATGTSTHRSATLSIHTSAKATKTTKTAKSTKTSKTSSSASRRAATSHTRRPKGQQSIDSERVMQIQQALIREHYMTGDPTGNWDSTTNGAMQKFQADQGWQTKLMPDSRAIKKLGLGPDYSGAINAKDSSFADPPPISTIPAPQSAGFASAAGVSQ